MSVNVDKGVIQLAGECDLADAERLVAALSEDRGRVVDVSQCRGMHAAVLQALLSLQPMTVGDPVDAFLRDFVVSSVRRPPPGGDDAG